MNQGNNYQQYGYDSYDAPPPRRRGMAHKIFGDRFMSRPRNPLFALAALLLTGAALAGIIIASYPGSDEGDIPVIKADAGQVRYGPEIPGGMSMPNEDSTIFGTVRSAELEESAPIENLLENEKPVDKIEAFAQEVEAQNTAHEDLKKLAMGKSAAEEQAKTETAETETANLGGDPNVKIIPMETVKIAPSAAPIERTASAPKATTKPAMPAAGTTPETLEYVRSVLEKKDVETIVAAAPTKANAPLTSPASAAPSAAAVASIEPAAGTTAAAAIKPGNYYVQVASVPSESGARTEWGKLQKSLGMLDGVDFRVKQADLGAKGTFYRVQAGPMSKDSAVSLCESIKAQKPGGCLIVQ